MFQTTNQIGTFTSYPTLTCAIAGDFPALIQGDGVFHRLNHELFIGYLGHVLDLNDQQDLG
jgi:hypothetical protein